MNNRKPGRDFSGDRKKPAYKGSFKRKEEGSEKPRRSFDKDSSDKPRRSFDKDSSDKPRRTFSKDSAEKSFDKPRRNFSKESSRDGSEKSFDKSRRDFSKDEHTGERDKFKKRFEPGEKKSYPEKKFNRPSKSFSKDKVERDSDKPRRNYDKDASEKKPYRGFSKDRGEKKSFDKDSSDKPKRAVEKDPGEKRYERKQRFYKKDFTKKKEKAPEKPTYADQGLTRLNKYIANAGICSRREADDLIKSGCVNVNGKIITELGFKVKVGDVVNCSGSQIKTEKPVYLLLNKPKDYITTASDDRGRRTVMELIDGACKERIYPVGRLDRNTTGLLLFTNDGEMTKKLTHPKHNVQKLYHVELDKNLKQTDLLKIRDGVELEDGIIIPDEVSYVGETKREVGIQIHSGANRVVRRIFESLQYEVLRLDRVMLAGLTKKNLPKGRWRFLTEQEVSFLKMV